MSFNYVSPLFLFFLIPSQKADKEPIARATLQNSGNCNAGVLWKISNVMDTPVINDQTQDNTIFTERLHLKKIWTQNNTTKFEEIYHIMGNIFYGIDTHILIKV